MFLEFQEKGYITRYASGSNPTTIPANIIAWQRGWSLVALAIAPAYCCIPNALFAIAEPFKGMYKHLLMPSGAYTALASLPAAIPVNVAKAKPPLFALLGGQPARVSMSYVHRWAPDHVCRHRWMTLQWQEVRSECHSVLVSWHLLQLCSMWLSCDELMLGGSFRSGISNWAIVL